MSVTNMANQRDPNDSEWREPDEDSADDLHDREDPDESEQDQDDADDVSDTEPCPYCNQEVHENADLCPHCGSFISFQPHTRRKPTWIIIGLILTALVIIGLLYYELMWLT